MMQHHAIIPDSGAAATDPGSSSRKSAAAPAKILPGMGRGTAQRGGGGHADAACIAFGETMPHPFVSLVGCHLPMPGTIA